jgi:hypothetical protein
LEEKSQNSQRKEFVSSESENKNKYLLIQNNLLGENLALSNQNQSNVPTGSITSMQEMQKHETNNYSCFKN